MQADDLHLAEVVTWRNGKNSWGNRLPKETVVRFDGNRYYNQMAGVFARSGTELLLLNLPAPLKLPATEGEYPPVMKFLLDARAKEAKEKKALWVDVDRPFWWDLPMLIAAGQVDSIEVAHGANVPRHGNHERKRRPAARPSSLPRPLGQRPVVAAHLFPVVGMRPAHSAQRRQRIGRVAEPRRLRSHVRSRRRRVELTRNGGRSSAPAACSSPTARC